MNNRIFICGITCGSEIDKIKDLVEKTKDYVDGYCWTVDDKPLREHFYKPKEQTLELLNFLESNKKSGFITQLPWKNAHDWSANEWLHCGVFKNGDWILMCDSSELPTNEWLKNIRDYISSFERDGHIASYWSGRPYLFKWSEYLYFQGTPHWGLYGLQGSVLYPKEETKAYHIINKRDLNPAKHYQEHDTKYYLYGRSNIIGAFYGKYGEKVVNMHEGIRRKFRDYLKKHFGEASLKTLDLLFAQKIDSWENRDFVIGVIEIEFCLSEYYRRTILKEDFMKDIVPKREKWSFENYLKTGNGFSDPEYLGTRLRYDKGIK